MSRRYGQSTFHESEEEMEWFFSASGGALGLKGCGGEPGGGERVWDAQRIHAAHMRLRTLEHRRGLAMFHKVHPTIAKLSPESWAAAFLTYSPRGWPDSIHSRFDRGAQRGNLVALTLAGDFLRAAWLGRQEAQRIRAMRAAKKADNPSLLDHLRELGSDPGEPKTTDLLAMLVNVAQSTNEIGKKERFFSEMREDAEARLQAGIAEYEERRRERETEDLARYVGDIR